jgi:hypothetical protein
MPAMTNLDEIQLSKLAKKMLATPYKNRQESKSRKAAKPATSPAPGPSSIYEPGSLLSIYERGLASTRKFQRRAV